VKGRSIELSLRFQVATLFATAFVAAALAAFAFAHFIGLLLHVSEFPAAWRLSLAGIVLVALSAADVHAVRSKTYCPISLRRQTPRRLMRQYPARLVALLWGLDTGLAVTTFRVSAATWGALFLTFLGFGTWWVGVFYGISFIVPLMAFICWGPVGEASVQPEHIDPGLDRLIASRPFAQSIAACLLSAGGIFALALASGLATTG
jgi:hypothetical protein